MIENKALIKTCFKWKKARLLSRVKKIELLTVLDTVLATIVDVFSIKVSDNTILQKP